MDHCPHCGSVSLVKAGIIADIQRYKCKDCGYHFTVTERGKPDWMKRMAIHLYIEGMSIRKIARILNVSDVAVGKWLQPVKSHLESCRKETVVSRNIHNIEHFMITRKLFQNFGWLVVGMEENEGVCLLGSLETDNCILERK